MPGSRKGFPCFRGIEIFDETPRCTFALASADRIKDFIKGIDAAGKRPQAAQTAARPADRHDLVLPPGNQHACRGRQATREQQARGRDTEAHLSRAIENLPFQATEIHAEYYGISPGKAQESVCFLKSVK